MRGSVGLMLPAPVRCHPFLWSSVAGAGAGDIDTTGPSKVAPAFSYVLRADKMQTVAIFVDAANFYNAAKSRGRFADLLKLRDFLTGSGGRELSEMIVYMGFPPDMKEENMTEEMITSRNNMFSLRDKLEYEGIMTVTHYGKADKKIQRGWTANVDVLMAMDALEYAMDTKPDIVVLVAGDVDYAYLAKKMRRRGIRVEAASIEGMIGGKLKKAVNGFINLDKFFDQLDGLPIGRAENFFDSPSR